MRAWQSLVGARRLGCGEPSVDSRFSLREKTCFRGAKAAFAVPLFPSDGTCVSPCSGSITFVWPFNICREGFSRWLEHHGLTGSKHPVHPVIRSKKIAPFVVRCRVRAEPFPGRACENSGCSGRPRRDGARRVRPFLSGPSTAPSYHQGRPESRWGT